MGAWIAGCGVFAIGLELLVMSGVYAPPRRHGGPVLLAVTAATAATSGFAGLELAADAQPLAALFTTGVALGLTGASVLLVRAWSRGLRGFDDGGDGGGGGWGGGEPPSGGGSGGGADWDEFERAFWRYVEHESARPRASVGSRAWRSETSRRTGRIT